MAIFIIKEKEISEVTFKVDASSINDAYSKVDKRVNEIMRGSEEYDNYRDIMNSSCYDSREHVRTYSNEDDFNMHYCGNIDFEIKDEKKGALSEPVYYAQFIDEDTGIVSKCCNYTLKDIMTIIREFNTDHILVPIPAREDFIKAVVEAKDRYVNPDYVRCIAFTMKRRKV